MHELFATEHLTTIKNRATVNWIKFLKYTLYLHGWSNDTTIDDIDGVKKKTQLFTESHVKISCYFHVYFTKIWRFFHDFN